MIGLLVLVVAIARGRFAQSRHDRAGARPRGYPSPGEGGSGLRRRLLRGERGRGTRRARVRTQRRRSRPAPTPGGPARDRARAGRGGIGCAPASCGAGATRSAPRFARMEPRAHQLSPLAGGTLALIELPTALPFFAAIAALSASGEPLTIQIGLVVLFQVLFLLPVLAIAIGCGPRPAAPRRPALQDPPARGPACGLHGGLPGPRGRDRARRARGRGPRGAIMRGSGAGPGRGTNGEGGI